MYCAIKKVALGCAIVSFSVVASANDLEGVIDSINPEQQSFIVQGIEFFTTETTDYDDGLRSFADLQISQRVEVDFVYRDNRHYATEVELDD